MKKKLVVIVVCMLFVIVVLPASGSFPDVLNKDKSISSDGDFDIQGAIDAASNGDIIVVPDGIYPGGIDFCGKAITLKSENGPECCIIDGDGLHWGVLFDSNEDSYSVLQGFTIRNCFSENRNGAGIYCGEQTSSTIINCIITDNLVEGIYDGSFGGAGIYCGRNANATVVNSIIKNNMVSVGEHCSAMGGGILCDRFSNATFISCLITGNMVWGEYNSYTYGGGICALYASPHLLSCTISNNSAMFNGELIGHAAGGGIALLYAGWYHTNVCAELKSCMIVNNIAQSAGGGMILRYLANVTVDSCTFSGNEVLPGLWGDGGGIYCGNSIVNIRNSILWDDFPQEIFICNDYNSSSVDIDFSDVDGGQDAIVNNGGPHTLIYGSMNIVSDPCFKDPENDDFHLMAVSSCIDAGDPYVDLDDWIVDFEGDIREYDILWISIPGKGPIDIGADELILYFLLGDVNNDGRIDFDDIDGFVVALSGEEIFYSQYPNGCYNAGDCNLDGSVDFDDIDPFINILGGS